ncbi:MAG TPA: hypothetical protein VEZ47_09915 [Gemmatirosa sp.]|nr:hypothetical protein [Gemmatirosa sp.]
MPVQPPAPPPPDIPDGVKIITAGPGGVSVTTGDGQAVVGTVPRTAAELSALRARRSELSKQLTSAQDRREELQEQLRQSLAGADRSGLEQRLQVLDQRIISLEQDMASTGRLVAAAPTLAGSEHPSGRPWRGNQMRLDLTAISIVFTLFVLMPVAVSIARAIWRRSTGAAPRAQAPAFDETRFQRLEQAVDAIAVEVERIGEGQRFVTQLLADRQRERVPIGAGSGAGSDANRVG